MKTAKSPNPVFDDGRNSPAIPKAARAHLHPEAKWAKRILGTDLTKGERRAACALLRYREANQNRAPARPVRVSKRKAVSKK